MRRVAAMLGCTEGQAYTLSIGLAMASLLLAGTVPAALRDRPASAAARDFELAAPPAPEAPASTDDPVDGEVSDPTTTSATFAGEAPSSPTLRPRVAAAPRSTPRSTETSPPAPMTATTTTTKVPSSAVPEVAPSPLAVLEGGWATTGAGTPAARANVPPDTLPVAANAGGSTTRRSFVRLEGTRAVLVLRLRSDAGANVNETGAAVLACVITDDRWMPQEAIALESAPPFDPERCVAGARRSDGSWQFDLAPFVDRTSRAGFTLVPDSARTTAPFQLAFDPTPGAPS